MKKLLIILMLVFLMSFSVGATELGLEQEWDGTTSLRLDTCLAMFAIPIDTSEASIQTNETSISIQEVEVGMKVPTTLGNSYLLAQGVFGTNNNNYWRFLEFKAGLGYFIDLCNWTIRGEFVAISPQWSNLSNWKYEPSLTFSFDFNIFGITGEDCQSASGRCS